MKGYIAIKFISKYHNIEKMRLRTDCNIDEFMSF